MGSLHSLLMGKKGENDSLHRQEEEHTQTTIGEEMYTQQKKQNGSPPGKLWVTAIRFPALHESEKNWREWESGSVPCCFPFPHVNG